MATTKVENTRVKNVWGRTSRRVVLTVLVTTMLVVFLGAFVRWPGRLGSHQAHAASDSPFVLVQMNLCLSGLASCFHDAHYPLGLGEARIRIADSHADAVTLNEVCSRDVEDLARAMGYHARFATVAYHGAPLPCSDPDGRGRYGIAVLTKAGIQSSTTDAYTAQDEVEQRQWICVTTDDAFTVCATHLDIRASSSTRAVNDAQCAEFEDVLEGSEKNTALIAAGDMNRPESCAAEGMWTRTDEQATQQPGLQHVYGNSRFSPAATTVVPMRYSDHDALVVTGWMSR